MPNMAESHLAALWVRVDLALHPAPPMRIGQRQAVRLIKAAKVPFAKSFDQFDPAVTFFHQSPPTSSNPLRTPVRPVASQLQ